MGKKYLKAVYASKGIIMDVQDEEVLESVQVLSKKEAIFLEPSGAMPLAAFIKLKKRRFFKKTDRVILIGTGNGLKDPLSAVKILPDPPTVEANLKEVERCFQSNLYQMQAVNLRSKDKVIWKKAPTISLLKKTIAKDFSVQFSQRVLKDILKTCKGFEIKGKSITHQDLQNILEEHLDEYTLSKKVLEVVDFSTKTSLNEKAEGEIKIRLNNKIYSSKSKGNGSVDALIKALNKCLNEKDPIKMKLTDYQVVIFSPGTNANVKVVIKAKDRKGNKVIGQGTSPDVIVASIVAYEKCYNFLYARQKQ